MAAARVDLAIDRAIFQPIDRGVRRGSACGVLSPAGRLERVEGWLDNVVERCTRLELVM